MYLGIDPGTKLGWAYIDKNGTRLSSDTIRLRHEKDIPGLRFDDAITHFRSLLSIRVPSPVKIIGYEHVRRWASSDAALVYNGIVACLFTEAYRHNIPVIGYAPTTIKKLYAGTGKATKEQMINAANTFFNIRTVDDNEADALWLAYHTYTQHK